MSHVPAFDHKILQRYMELPAVRARGCTVALSRHRKRPRCIHNSPPHASIIDWPALSMCTLPNYTSYPLFFELLFLRLASSSSTSGRVA